MALRIGLDLLHADRVAESIATHSERYLDRVFTAEELRDCAAADGPDPDRLAARFAAKEATIKVLRPGADEPVAWRDIAVLRGPAGAPALRLTGSAAALAAAAGIDDVAVSLTHEGGLAGAVVIAHADQDPT